MVWILGEYVVLRNLKGGGGKVVSLVLDLCLLVFEYWEVELRGLNVKDVLSFVLNLLWFEEGDGNCDNFVLEGDLGDGDGELMVSVVLWMFEEDVKIVVLEVIFYGDDFRVVEYLVNEEV